MYTFLNRFQTMTMPLWEIEMPHQTTRKAKINSHIKAFVKDDKVGSSKKFVLDDWSVED